MMARFKSLVSLIKTTKNNRCQSWASLEKIIWIRACNYMDNQSENSHERTRRWIRFCTVCLQLVICVCNRYAFVILLLKLSGKQRSGPEVIKVCSCSTQLSTKFQLLIKSKIPTNIDVFLL